MDAEAYRNKTVPSARSLFHESQALLFAGTDTVGTTLMVGTHRLLKSPDKMQKLKAELVELWPYLETDVPRLRDLENLPYLNAVIKESLRLSSGVTTGLSRLVPSPGATIAGVNVPPHVRPSDLKDRIRLTDHTPGPCLMWEHLRSQQRIFIP